MISGELREVGQKLVDAESKRGRPGRILDAIERGLELLWLISLCGEIVGYGGLIV